MFAVRSRIKPAERDQFMSNKQIVIIGFMGTGKTTVAEVLARRLNCGSLDLDELITERQGRTPQLIIESEGEAVFRRIETEMLREALSDANAGVVAAGGGAWTIPGNRELIASQGALAVWLDAPFELCWKRIEAGSQTRPLARSRPQAEELYAARQPVYELAPIRIPVAENESVEELVAKLVRAFSQAADPS